MPRRLFSVLTLGAGLMSGVGAFVACGGDDPVAPVDDAAADVAPDVVADAAPDVEPGPTRAIWTHTSSTLYRFDPETHALDRVADFSCAPDLVFDIAVDEAERMVAVTSLGLVAVDPKTAVCTPIAGGTYPHAIGFVAKGILDPTQEVLVGFNFAQYVKIDVKSGAMTPIGSLNTSGTGVTWVVSGDLVYDTPARIEVTVLGAPDGGDVLVYADPKTGHVTKVVRPLGKLGMTGLGQWAGTTYAFGQQGDVLAAYGDGSVIPVYPPADASTDATADADAAKLQFRGAGSSTRAPIK